MTAWSKLYAQHMCGPTCQGICPCPDPPWKWKCNQIPKSPKQVDSQMIWQKPLPWGRKTPSFGQIPMFGPDWKCGYAYVGDYD